jgi:dipeptidyl-peptidase 4
MRIFSIHLFLIFQFNLFAQKTITLEDIWTKGTFRTKPVPGFNFLKDGKTYTSLEANGIEVYDIVKGEKTETILEGKNLKNVSGFSGNIEGYTFSYDEQKIILEENQEMIYRHSSKADVYIYDRKSKELHKVFDLGKISNVSVCPDGSKAAFVFENNLYFKELPKGKITQITTDGKKNEIINGMCDWVYEEEFGFTKAYEWSGDGQKIGFIRFDESKVTEYIMPMYEDGVYPRYETFKYPKVGEKNADVKVIIYDTKSKKMNEAALGNLTDMYIPRIKWTQDANKLCVFKMNRLQNHLQLYLVDGKEKKASILMEEKNKSYIEINDNLTFLKDGKHFLWTSEKKGFNSIYLYNMSGQEVNQITESKYDVLEFYGVDDKKSIAYFKAAEKSPMEHHVFSVKLDGKGMKNLTPAQGVNNAQFSPTFDFYSWSNSTANTPATYSIMKNNGDKVRVLQDNAGIKNLMKEYNVQPIEFFQITTSEKVKLNGWQIKPVDFSPNKKYPVLVTQYSGPGSQTVTDGWKGNDYWWYQMLAQKGYMIVSVDTRGTGARGEDFRKITYQQLGHYETLDMIETAKYLGALPHVDKDRIGIFGWSYGGYMSSLAILKGNDVFKSAIAVAPVTNWKWYDSVYTERYMRTLKDNEAGYKENSPVYFADKLKGNYLLVHGTADDNVHFQNSVEMANALINANKQFDTYYYPNKNHGIFGGNARIHLYTKMTDFLINKL